MEIIEVSSVWTELNCTTAGIREILPKFGKMGLIALFGAGKEYTTYTAVTAHDCHSCHALKLKTLKVTSSSTSSILNNFKTFNKVQHNHSEEIFCVWKTWFAQPGATASVNSLILSILQRANEVKKATEFYESLTPQKSQQLAFGLKFLQAFGRFKHAIHMPHTSHKPMANNQDRKHWIVLRRPCTKGLLNLRTQS